MYDTTTTLEAFIAATAAKQPTPGGGSVSALVGALAAALGEMCVNYSLNKKGLEAFADEFRPAVAELQRARAMLLQLMVEDQLAYEAYAAMRKLPADSKERRERFPAVLLACVRVPQALAATGVGVLERCERLINFVNPYLLADLAVCADLAMASIRCAIYNVRTNLAEVTDPEDRRSIEGTIGQILQRAVTLIQNVAPRIWERHSQGV
jgi:formiminotetrahydrofolate cyclodeaminase